MNRNYDELLKIETGNRGANQRRAIDHNHYEATPYSFLHALFEEYSLQSTDHLVDFGSGRGRLIFYVHHRFGNCVTGVENDLQLHKDALENKVSYIKKTNTNNVSIQFIQCSAEDYKIQKRETVYYFFNPFSLKVFKKVIANILLSFEEQERRIELIFYYPRQKYLDYLAKETPFTLKQEILIPGISRINEEERFLVYVL